MTAQIHPGAFVDPAARLGVDVRIGPGAVIGPDVTLGDRTRVDSHALIEGWTTVGADCHIHHGAVLGTAPQDLKYERGAPSFLVVGDHTAVREYVTANLATEAGGTTRIGSHCLLMAYAHVAHNDSIGDHVVIANAVQLAGYVSVEDWVIIGGTAGVHQFVRIGCHAMVGGGARVTKDIAPYVKGAGGTPKTVGAYYDVAYDRVLAPREDMRSDLVRLIRQITEGGADAFVLVNNRAEGCAPLTIRAPNCMGTFRLGVEGSWSVTSSTIASSVKIQGVQE